MVDEFRLRLEAEARRLAEMRRVIREWLSTQQVDRVDDVVLAVDEAVANAIEHAGLRGTLSFIDVVAKNDGRSISVEVTDEGAWRPEVDDDTRGRGLMIISAVMDDVQVSTTPRGTRVSMRRSIEAERYDRAVDDEQ